MVREERKRKACCLELSSINTYTQLEVELLCFREGFVSLRPINREGKRGRVRERCILHLQATALGEATHQAVQFYFMQMGSSTSITILSIGLLFLLSFFSSFCTTVCISEARNNTLRVGEELRKYKRARALLKRLNKPSLKIIQSPDGDTIDCVPIHKQPAFDHPRLRGQKPLEPPKRPRGHVHARNISINSNQDEVTHIQQLWTVSGEACPDGTIPIRRTKEDDILRARSIKRFGRKPVAAGVRRDSISSGHEHAVGFVMGEQYYGAKASMNVWAPQVASQSEFSLSQIWVISGSFGNDLNTIEAGWQVSPQLYGDNLPRFFTYWTTDAYQATGCYNLLCSGFVQTNNRIAMGAAISPTSSYRGAQFDISLLIWKDPNHGNWWLEFGSGVLVGYWPSVLFSHLADHASMIQFGGEIVNTGSNGFHSETQMGSGHFAHEGFGKSAYFRNLEIVDWDNSLIPLTNLRVLADHPNCYDIQGGINTVWGNYFYFGGPGRNMKCP
ncbi:hypothetical protein LUZ63_014741 [Rhynchospora breviuscula]|uniref:Neprosin PEP catalytic domain-containing protein n=1 Tax=Rhynchospora breviuscula TaxID=2022672 RepID=A0A9Q0CAY9_9POAL|nr:hypothetical protein LUZ63_014741 [Rhynchospora breviuscula]